ncbi:MULTISPECIES: hypothetical protein [Streptomyces]|uniref:hypothetical protein n=1 Tax=Streptomyces TaxID=1883 RepID=UPI000F77EB6C|nr:MULTISPECIES: hypothetical protein [Streptomyces]RST00978.1 hypothetical protein EF910_29795 [Streptomyces sp. WAC07149]GLX22677.1 hypothetical protein Slala01_63210 [Streptomyces lavendulae subsp. lavendulae]GLX24205.1 hypothetical protein Slala02_00250 [Streptomyces lavendulae subsp. lavendulae]
MRPSRIAAAAALGLVPVLAGCGTSAEAEKSIADVRKSVDRIQGEMKLETKAVAARDARTEVESVRLVAQLEADNLKKFASRAPAETQEFADAAQAWAEAVATSRAAIITRAPEATSTAAMLTVRLNTKRMDEEAEELGIDPWLKLGDY